MRGKKTVYGVCTARHRVEDFPFPLFNWMPSWSFFKAQLKGSSICKAPSSTKTAWSGPSFVVPLRVALAFVTGTVQGDLPSSPQLVGRGCGLLAVAGRGTEMLLGTTL